MVAHFFSQNRESYKPCWLVVHSQDSGGSEAAC